ncbi:hypothetical protein KSH70_026820, partial [Escherichia coli]|nr:hypothetical protein [Escherichia coli]
VYKRQQVRNDGKRVAKVRDNAMGGQKPVINYFARDWLLNRYNSRHWGRRFETCHAPGGLVYVSDGAGEEDKKERGGDVQMNK